jgi:hypothetical protein
MRLFPTRRRRHFTKIINPEMNPSNPLGLEHGVTEAGYSIILGLVLVESYVGAHVGAMEHDRAEFGQHRELTLQLALYDAIFQPIAVGNAAIA